MESKLLNWSHLLLLLLLVSLHPGSHAQSGTTSSPLGLSLRDNLKDSFSVMVLAFLSALVFMAFFSLYLRHCTNTYVRPRNPIAAAAADLLRRRLHHEAINKCPILVYSAMKELKIGKSDRECAVCLGEFQDKDKIRLLPKCHHLFHPNCIDEWFSSNPTCPVCRALVTSSDSEDNAAAVEIPTESNLNESATASGEIEQESTAESREPPSVTIHVDESESSTGPPTQTTPPIQSRITERFPRSHSTGHSLIMEPEEMMDRYRLRLPEHVSERILVNHHSGIRRSASSDVVLQGVWSSKRRSDNLERWVLFSMTPPFGLRDWSSVKSSNQDTERSSRVRPPV